MPVDELERVQTVAASAAGVALLSFAPNRPDAVWSVEQVSVQTTGGACTAAVYKNGALICATSSGQLDSADGAPAVTIEGSDQLQIQWTGAGNGVTCTARIAGLLGYGGDRP